MSDAPRGGTAVEANTDLAALLERVEKGEEIVITRKGCPVARLVPFERSHSRPNAVPRSSASRAWPIGAR
jgi:prevent-host-death family protein